VCLSSAYLRVIALALFLLFSGLTGCAGTRSVQDKSCALAGAGRFDEALAVLDSSSLASSRTDRLLYLMERGLLLHLQGSYTQSTVVLDQAEQLSEELFTKSVSAGAASFLINDQIIAYNGADYEVVYLNYYKALNYLLLGNLEAAGVEARRVDLKLRQFEDAYAGKTVFKEDAFLRMLTGLIYQAQGDWNNAFIAYRLAHDSFVANRQLYGVPVPVVLWSLLTTTAQRSGLLQERDTYRALAAERGVQTELIDSLAVVLINNGRIPVKRERMALFPTEEGFPVKIALPEFVARPGGVTSARLSVAGQEVTAEPVENLAAIAFKSLDDRIGRVLAKAIARALAKEIAARQLERQHGDGVGLLSRLFNIVTENADLRSWSGLPASVLLAAVPVASGDHPYRLFLDGRPVEGSLVVPAHGVGFAVHRTY
jgi:hypothetical protein